MYVRFRNYACGGCQLFLTQAELIMIFPENVAMRSFRIFQLKNVRLLNPRSGCRTRAITTIVVENPHIKVYSRILVKNTLSAFNVSTHHRSGIMSDDEGRTWKLWAFTDSLSQYRQVGRGAESYLDRTSLTQAIADFQLGILVDPPVDLSSEALYLVRVDACRAGPAENLCIQDPDYAWSIVRFEKAESDNHRSYFAMAVLHPVSYKFPNFHSGGSHSEQGRFAHWDRKDFVFSPGKLHWNALP